MFYNRKGYLVDFLGNEKVEQIKKINVGDSKKISKSHALIIFNDNQKVFEITNLSKNEIFVNKKFLSQFESAKLKNKNALVVGREMFFFIYSKSALLSYYKNRFDKLSRLREKNSSQSAGKMNNNFVTPINVNTTANTMNESKISQKKNKKRIHTNANLKPNVQDERFNNSAYAFENILPPNPDSIFNKNNDNILDDLIESSNRKIKINIK